MGRASVCRAGGKGHWRRRNGRRALGCVCRRWPKFATIADFFPRYVVVKQLTDRVRGSYQKNQRWYQILVIRHASPSTRDGPSAGATATVPPPRAGGLADPLPNQIPPRRFSRANAGRISWRLRAALVLDAQIRRGSEDAPSPQDATSFLFLGGIKRLQSHCNGPDGPFQRATR